MTVIQTHLLSKNSNTTLNNTSRYTQVEEVAEEEWE